MSFDQASPFLQLLKNRIDLRSIPFSERGSRLMLFCPDGYLAVRLAERWFKRDPHISAYRKRPPLIDRWQFTDADGQPLPLETVTYPHKVECHTPVGVFTVAFVDAETLLVALPAGRMGMTFQARLDEGRTDRRGGVLRLTGQVRRNIAYTTNAHLVRNEIHALGPGIQELRLLFDARPGDALLLHITPRLGFNRWVPHPQEVVESAARRWHEWFAAVPPVADPFRSQYYYAWWIMRSGLISSRFYTTREAMTPSKVHYVGVWQWDAYFHALAYRHVDMKLAKDQIRILLDHQREDGMIPDAVHDEGIITRLTFPVEADVTKPPLIAWAAWKLYETDGDREFLDEIYEPIVRWNTWWFKYNDLDGNGLCEYQHPFSSGLDDSPLWDEGMPVESPDLNTYLCLQQEALARMAAVIGEEKDVEKWEALANNIVERMIQVMWDEETGYFWAHRYGRRINVRTPFNLFPLLTGRLPRNITDRLVAHLTNEEEFWTRYPVPTVARNDPKYDPLTMWRGPTWINVNYLMIEGLRRAGYETVARELRDRTLELVQRHRDIYEYYHPETGDRPPRAAPIFGWSAALFIELALEASQELERMTT